MQRKIHKINWLSKLPKTLLALMLVFLAIRGFFLIYPDLNITYPFMFTDSYDWIANGLHYAGYDVKSSFRAPALPIIIAVLEKFNILFFLPVLNQFILGGILLILFKILEKKFKKPAALLTIAIFFFNFFLQNLSLYILADIYALFFILLGYRFYQLAKEKEEFYMFSAFSFSISFLFQYAILFAVPAFIIHFLLFRRKSVTKNWILKTFLAFTLPTITWLIYKKIFFGSFLYSGVKHLELIKFHTDSIFFYLFNTVSVLGIAVFLLFAIGLIWSIFIKKEDEILEFLYLNLLGFSFWIAFWVFFYDWNDRRFLIYAFPFLVSFVAFTVQKIFIEGFQKVNIAGKFAVSSLLYSHNCQHLGSI